jgi:hypothetical protein
VQAGQLAIWPAPTHVCASSAAVLRLELLHGLIKFARDEVLVVLLPPTVVNTQ